MTTKPGTPEDFDEDENDRLLGLIFDVQNRLKKIVWCAVIYDHAIFYERDAETRAKALAEAISEWWEAERIQRASEKSSPPLRLTLSA